MKRAEYRLVEEIVVRPNRVRKDMGDIPGLAADIVKSDFMPPLLVAPITNELIDGHRRLLAARRLGWKKVPVAVVPIHLVARGEIVAQNQKPYTWAEKVAIYTAIKPVVEVEARERRNSRLRKGTRPPDGESFPDGATGRTRDLVASYLGDTSGKTLEQAATVFASGHDDLKVEIERSGKVNKAYRTLLLRDRTAGVTAAPLAADERLLLGDCRDVLKRTGDDTFDAVITDPPFGVGFRYADGVEDTSNPEEYERFIVPLFQELVRVVRPGGLVAVWQSSRHMPHLWRWFGTVIKVFFACKRHVQYRAVPMNDAVDPVVCYWKPGAVPRHPARQRDSVNWHPSTMQYDDLARLHPCPRPLDLCDHLVYNFVPEGGYVFDGFAGSGSVLVAAQRLGHPWMGVERNPDYRRIAFKHLEMLSRPVTSEEQTEC